MSDPAPVTRNHLPERPFNCYASLLDMPKLFGTTISTIPQRVPYIYPSPDARRKWTDRLNGPAFRIGIVWAGDPDHGNDRNRSAPLME